MDEPELSPSDQIARPRSLTERLKAEAAIGQSPQIEAASFMAERFAPELPPHATHDAGLTMQGGQVPGAGPAFAPPRERGRGASRVLPGAFLIVALVPTLACALLVWQGMIVLPWPALMGRAATSEARSPTQQASIAGSAPETVLRKQDIALPSVALTLAGTIAATAGKEAPFALTLDSAQPLPLRSIITIRGLPQGTTFSAGRPYGDTEWSLRPDEIGDLRLLLPSTASGERAISIELLAGDGSTIATAATRIAIAPDAKAALVLRPEDGARVAELMAHGRKMIEVGYVAGARSYFNRAAEAGSAEAALALGATYDPDFIAEIGAQGIKPDFEAARVWYERAKALGSTEAEDHLAALDRQAQPVAPVVAAASEPATAKAVVATAAPPSQAGPGGGVEWVETSGAVNVRAAPTPQAQTIKVAERGTRYQATARKGSWVQVTDPATAEVGWVYARYVAASSAPGR
jgi:Bacterial SH3 domain